MTKEQKKYWQAVHQREEEMYGKEIARKVRIYGSLGWESYLRDSDEQDEEIQKGSSRRGAN